MYLSCEEGQGLVEYALILVLAVLVVVVALTAIGPQVVALYTRITSMLP
jgi:Flp pilus assembly pilin Flp